MTAYFGFIKIGTPKAGETLVVSGAAGAVGKYLSVVKDLDSPQQQHRLIGGSDWEDLGAEGNRHCRWPRQG